MKKTALLFAVALGFMVSSCSNNAKEAEENTEATTEQSTEAAAPAESENATITLNAGDDMKYDLSEIKVKEGQKVTLTLHHTGKLAKEAMGHNFVLLAQGVVAAAFTADALKAKDTDYIPAGDASQIIAHTKLIGGGESDTIEFTAPAKGTYEFLCSFPGHSAMMKGTFIVE